MDQKNQKKKYQQKTEALCLMLVAAFVSLPLRRNSSCINHFQDASPLSCTPVQLPYKCMIH